MRVGYYNVFEFAVGAFCFYKIVYRRDAARFGTSVDQHFDVTDLYKRTVARIVRLKFRKINFKLFRRIRIGFDYIRSFVLFAAVVAFIVLIYL